MTARGWGFRNFRGLRSLRRALSSPILAAPIVAFLMVGDGDAAKDETGLVSLAKVVPGGKVNAGTFAMSVSGDGRYVAFSTQASNLDANDTNTDNIPDDVYVRDTVAETTTLVTPGDGPGDAAGADPVISDDGETVAFVAYDDIDPDDNNNENDVYVADMTADPPTLALASRPTGSGAGAPAPPEGSTTPAISDDGNVVAFISSDNTLDATNDGDTLAGAYYSQDVFVRDLSAETTELVSRGAADGNRASWGPSLDSDGSHVGFDTQASNLDVGDSDEDRDVYVRDRTGATLTLVSRADGPAGAKANGDAVGPSLSGDGDMVTFNSGATNLDPDDSDTTPDVFVRDVGSDDTELVSRAGGASGAKGNKASQIPSISADGTKVAFISAADNLHPDQSTTGSINHGYIRNLADDTITLQSRADGGSGPKANNGVGSVVISSNGQALGFTSTSTNLDPIDTDSLSDIYVRNTGSGATVLASQAPFGTPVNANGDSRDPSVSADGRYVAFGSGATNLHPDAGDTSSDVFVLDTQTGDVELASRASGAAGADGDNSSREPSISAGGRYVAFESEAENLAADGDGESDVYVRDLVSDTTSLVSLDSSDQNVTSGGASDVSISGNGQRVAFATYDSYHPDDANSLSDIYVRDLAGGTTVVASRPNGTTVLTGEADSYEPDISADGSSVAFESDADNLTGVSPVQQIVVRDIDANTTRLVSRASGAAGVTGSHESREPSISSDGSRVSFHSDSPNLHPDDLFTNGSVFVRDLDDNQTILASRASNGDSATSYADDSAISGDGTYVAFSSDSNNLDPDSSDTKPDIYVRDLLAGLTKMVSRADGPSGAEGNDTDRTPAISEHGRFVAFGSSSTNLDPADTDSSGDVYLREVLDPDSDPPGTTITGGPAAGSFNSQPALTFTFTVDEAFATSECRIDGGAFAACSGNFPTGQLSDGSHTFEVRSTDRVGNLESPAKSRGFSVDTVAPDTVIDSGPSGASSKSSPAATFHSSEPAATLDCSIDGAAFSPCGSPLTLGPLPDGDHTFRVRSTDQAGNLDASPAERSFRVDTVVTGRRAQVRKVQKVKKKKLKVTLTVRPGEKATIKLSGNVTGGGGKLKQVKKQAAEGKKATLVARLMKNKLNKKIARKLSRGKKIKAKLTIVVVDAVGNAKKVKTTVRLK